MQAENVFFLVSTSTDMVYVWVVEIDLVLYAGKSLGFSGSIEIGLIFV